MSATFFETGDEFRKWLEMNHDKETKLIVGFYKVDSGRPSINWSPCARAFVTRAIKKQDKSIKKKQ